LNAAALSSVGGIPAVINLMTDKKKEIKTLSVGVIQLIASLNGSEHNSRNDFQVFLCQPLCSAKERQILNIWLNQKFHTERNPNL
jgi:hypothetical protein